MKKLSGIRVALHVATLSPLRTGVLSAPLRDRRDRCSAKAQAQALSE